MYGETVILFVMLHNVRLDLLQSLCHNGLSFAATHDQNKKTNESRIVFHSGLPVSNGFSLVIANLGACPPGEEPTFWCHDPLTTNKMSTCA